MAVIIPRALRKLLTWRGMRVFGPDRRQYLAEFV
jgi:hypothetical protein